MNLGSSLEENLSQAGRYGFIESLQDTDELTGSFKCFHDLAVAAPRLLKIGALGQEVSNLPIVDSLPAESELQLAKMALSFLSQAYVWEPTKHSGGDPRTVLPEQLARPMLAVSKVLGEPPIYLYADHTLRNSRLIDSAVPICIENLKSLYSFSGTDDEEQFVIVHTSYESIGIPAVKEAISAIRNDLSGRLLEEVLLLIANTFSELRTEFLNVKKTVSPETFRNEIRLFLMGWHGNLPSMEYEGTAEKVGKLRGETGAGSALLPFFDRFTGCFVKPNSESEAKNSVLGPDATFKNVSEYFEFDEYRPIQHRQVLEWTASSSNIRGKAESGEIKKEVYNSLLKAILDLRIAHLKTVGVYMQGGSNKYMQGGIGTGGSKYGIYLKALADHTEQRLL